MYAPLDITVVDLTASFQTVNGQNVRAAASLDEVSQTLGLNELGTENNDSYLLIGQFLIGATNDNPALFASNAYTGLASAADVGGNNLTDGTALVLLAGTGDSPQFFGNVSTMRQGTCSA